MSIKNMKVYEQRREKEPLTSFDDFWAKLGVELVEFAMYDWRGYRDAAISDGYDFLEKAQDDIQRWCKILEEGMLSQEDLAMLLVGKKDLAGLALLRHADCQGRHWTGL